MAKQTNRGKPKQIDLAVLETTEWYTKDRTLTVRPLFQMLTQIIYDNPNWFHYATFMGSASFVEALENLVHKDGVNYIYIGAHGQDDKIQSFLPGDRHPNKTTWERCFSKGALRGIFLGGCEMNFLAHGISCYLTRDTHNPPPWVAGYWKTVDWVDASMLDLAFLREAVNPKVKSEKAIRAVLESLQRRGYGEMMDALGFTVYIGGKEIYFGDRETAFGDSDGEKIENDDEA